MCLVHYVKETFINNENTIYISLLFEQGIAKNLCFAKGETYVFYTKVSSFGDEWFGAKSGGCDGFVGTAY